jgi:ABC-type sugar transport system substrate-binding protein
MRKSIIFIGFLLAITLVFSSVSCSAYQQTEITMSTAIESSTVETTLLEIPDTSAEEVEKIPQNFNMLYVPKIDDISWFNVVEAGLKKCANDYGFNLTVIGPPKSDPAIQAQIVLDNISKGFSAIVACPLDDEMIDSAFSRANEAGVMTFSNEGYTLNNITFNIEAMSAKAFGESIMKAGIDYSGGTGGYIVSVGFLDNIVQNKWADFEISYQQENAPGLENVLNYTEGTDRFEDKEDDSVAYEKLEEFLEKSIEFDLIIGNSYSTGIAAGEFISKKRLKGDVAFTGAGMPVTIGSYIEDGVLQEGFFWDPFFMGYATGYIALKSWMGQTPVEGDPVLEPGGNAIEGYQKLGISSNENSASVIYGNAIYSITSENIEEWYNKFNAYGWPQR